MNIQPSHNASSAAGSSRAVRRGGESEKQSAESSRVATDSAAPAGKASESNSIDEGDQTRDRRGDGRQSLSRDADQFELSEVEQVDANSTPPRIRLPDPEQGSQLDFEA